MGLYHRVPRLVVYTRLELPVQPVLFRCGRRASSSSCLSHKSGGRDIAGRLSSPNTARAKAHCVRFCPCNDVEILVTDTY